MYNIDNVFKKYNMNMYNLLSRKYILTKSNKLIFIRHKYDKKEYIIKLLKKNKNYILKDNESYKTVADEILKHDIEYYTKYINDFSCKRALGCKYCYYVPCFNKVLDDNYCDIHKDKKMNFSYKIYIIYGKVRY